MYLIQEKSNIDKSNIYRFPECTCDEVQKIGEKTENNDKYNVYTDMQGMTLFQLVDNEKQKRQIIDIFMHNL